MSTSSKGFRGGLALIKYPMKDMAVTFSYSNSCCLAPTRAGYLTLLVHVRAETSVVVTSRVTHFSSMDLFRGQILWAIIPHLGFLVIDLLGGPLDGAACS